MTNGSSFYKKVIASLNSKGIQFIIIGGHAVIYYGYEFITHDMDIWYNPAGENAEKLRQFMMDLGYDVSALDIQEMTHIDTNPISLRDKESLIYIDFMSGISADIPFDEAYQKAQDGKLYDQPVKFLTLEHLKKAKQMSGREKDKAHLEFLNKIHKKQAE